MAFSIVTRIRNRWRVAYTLIRNPSIQKYTAKNIELLKKDEKQAHVFSLEHTIKRHSTIGEEEAGGTEKLVYGEELGMEVKPQENGDPEEVAAVVVKQDLREENPNSTRSNNLLTRYERMA